MLGSLIHDTGFRRYTYVFMLVAEGLAVAAAVCHYKNSETEDILETPNDEIGLEIATARLNEGYSVIAVDIEDANEVFVRLMNGENLSKNLRVEFRRATDIRDTDYYDEAPVPDSVKGYFTASEEARKLSAEVARQEVEMWDKKAYDPDASTEDALDPRYIIDDEVWIDTIYEEECGSDSGCGSCSERGGCS